MLSHKRKSTRALYGPTRYFRCWTGVFAHFFTPILRCHGRPSVKAVLSSLVSPAVPGSAAAPAIILALILALGATLPAQAGVLASGGTESDITVGGTSYRMHTFTNSGSFVVHASDLEVEYLILAGGGGGGATGTSGAGGGGGAGGLVMGTGSLQSKTFSVTVGAGGAGSTDFHSSDGENGGDSSIAGVDTATGGGGGGSTWQSINGLSGGCGGGAASKISSGSYYLGDGANGVGAQGYNGGDSAGTGSTSDTARGAGGGGGGVDGPGGNASVPESFNVGGDGGGGVQWNLGALGNWPQPAGLAAGIGGGGGGGGSDFNATGDPGSASHGGGAGGQSGSGADAELDTGGGGGGGGGGNDQNGPGGNGGSGIVIIRYALENRITVTGSPGVTIDAMGIDAGAEPSRTVVGNDARLRWVSVGSNIIQVKLADTSPALPSGVNLSVKIGDLEPVPVTNTWTTITPSTDAVGDEPIEYSVSLDPMSSLSATTPVTVDVSYQIQSN